MRVVLYKPQYLRLILKIVDQIKSANLSIYLMKIFLFFSSRCCSTIWQKGFQWWITQWVKEFTKLRAFRAYVPYVPMQLTCLRAFVPQITTCLRVVVPQITTCLRSYVPTFLLALHYYVPTCLCALNYYVPTCLRSFRAYVLYMSTWL